MKPNGTHAKDIAIYFFDHTNQRATKQIFMKTVVTAKSLLSNGYSKEEILKAIDYLIEQGVNMHSLGYVSASINDVLVKVREREKKETSVDTKKDMEEYLQEQRRKGGTYEIQTNNRNKRKRVGVQSKFREKFDLNLPKKS